MKKPNVLRGRKAIRKYGWLPLLALITVIFAAEVISLSLAQFRGFNMKYFDVGAMSQAVWSATQGEPLIFSGQGFDVSRLARNVEIVYFLLAPLYHLAPRPETLLILQNALFVAASIPLFSIARRKLNNPYYSLVIVLIYLLYPIAHTSVLFEFHGDTLAMSFLIFAIEAADRDSKIQYFIWLILALSSKWYVGIPVAFYGAILWKTGKKGIGRPTAILGFLWSVAAFLILLPVFAPRGTEAIEARATNSTYILSRFNALDLQNTWVLRIVNALIVALPAVIVLGWRAPLWLIPAAVVIIPALLSSGFGPSFSYRTHHYAVAVPFLMMAIIMGAYSLLTKQRASSNKSDYLRYRWKGRLILTLIVTLIFHIAFVDTPLNPNFYLASDGSAAGLDDARYGVKDRDYFKDKWIATNVPENVSITADEIMATRLTNRKDLFLTQRPYVSPLEEVLEKSDYVVTDALYDYMIAIPKTGEIGYGGIKHEQETIRFLLRDPSWQLVRGADGLLLFRRGELGLIQKIEILPLIKGELFAQITDNIGLLSVVIDKNDNQIVTMEIDWIINTPLEAGQEPVIVSYLKGIPHSRVPHLPSMFLLTPKQWPADRIIRETIEFELPDGIQPGEYSLAAGIFDSSNLYASETDQRSRIGEEIELGIISISG